jgi:hypothetical protein
VPLTVESVPASPDELGDEHPDDGGARRRSPNDVRNGSPTAPRRRIERQIREVLGSKLRSYDVRVVGREVTVHARSSRFWQRRAVRNALESLPALSGYRTSILVDE